MVIKKVEWRVTTNNNRFPRAAKESNKIVPTISVDTLRGGRKGDHQH